MESKEFKAEHLSVAGTVNLSDVELELGREGRPDGQYRTSTALQFHGQTHSIGDGFLKEFAVTRAQADPSYFSAQLDFGDSLIDVPLIPQDGYVGWMEIVRLEKPLSSGSPSGLLHFRVMAKFAHEDLLPLLWSGPSTLNIEPFMASKGICFGYRAETSMLIYIRTLKIRRHFQE
jgi:hypothetical protein